MREIHLKNVKVGVGDAQENGIVPIKVLQIFDEQRAEVIIVGLPLEAAKHIGRQLAASAVPAMAIPKNGRR